MFEFVEVLLELEDSTKNAKNNDWGKVDVEFLTKASEWTWTELTVEGNFIGEISSEQWNTSYESVGSEECRQVNNENFLVFPWKVSNNEGTEEWESNKNSNVLQPLNENEGVEKEASEETSSSTQ